jgi:polyphosphate glucokinase
VEEYLSHVIALLSPSLVIIGGGVSRKSDKFLPKIHHLPAKIVPATLHNDAGIVGAAMAAVPPS